MQVKIKKNTIVILVIILLMVALVSWVTFLRSQSTSPATRSYILCDGQELLSRANATACRNARFDSENEFLGTLLNPDVKQVRILVNPSGGGGLALAAEYLQVTLNGMNIQNGVAYTEEWPAQPDMPVMSIDDAFVEYPIIWLKENTNKSGVLISGSGITIEGKNQADLDALMCRVAFLLFNTAMDCKFIEG